MRSAASSEKHDLERQNRDGLVVMQHIDTLRRAEQARITSFRLANDLGLTAQQAEQVIASLVLRGFLAPAGAGQRLDLTPQGIEWLEQGGDTPVREDR